MPCKMYFNFYFQLEMKEIIYKLLRFFSKYNKCILKVSRMHDLYILLLFFT